MAREIKPNLILINSPAGSGKTTTIKNEILKITIDNPNTKILCITFTNRATDELNRIIDSVNVEISTIHTYINQLLSPLFKSPEVISLFIETYKNQIQERIADKSKADSNQTYIDKYGNLNLDTIKQNIKQLKYNETQFNNLFYGRLCHDDLLDFSYILFKKYPKLNNKISQKYQHVFIDEYQDTAKSIINLFFDAINETNARLYLFGDQMQQIYKSPSMNVEDLLVNFENRKLKYNYRSSQKIVNVLNNIYNDKEYNQEKPIDYTSNEEISPLAVYCSDMNAVVESYLKETPSALRLYLVNRERFEKMGAINLFNSINIMERYSFGKKYRAVDVLTMNNSDNPDDIFKFLFFMNELSNLYQEKKYGKIFQNLKNNIFIDNKKIILSKHSDKATFVFLLKEVFKKYDTNTSIKDFLIFLQKDLGILVNSKFENLLNDAEYASVLENNLGEFKNLVSFLEQKNISTQHAVKGEGHNNVFFIAEDSIVGELNVRMYEFFKLMSEVNLSFSSYQNFCNQYFFLMEQIEVDLGCKIQNINRNTIEKHNEYLKSKAENIREHFKKDCYFEVLCKNNFDAFIDRHTQVGLAKECFKKSLIEGILFAYKLFYVGCSRAKKTLTIFIQSAKINKNNFEKIFTQLGFDIKIMTENSETIVSV